MRGALFEVGRALRLGWAYAPFAMGLALVLAPLTAGTTAASAAVQRALINGADHAGRDKIVVVALLAGLVFTMWLVLLRLQGNLWSIVSDRTVPELRAQVLSLIDSRSEFESITDPSYLDDLERLRRVPAAPIELPWVLLSAVMTIVSLGLSVVLLMSVDWRLCLIILGATLSLVVSLFASRREIQEIERLTVLERNERQIHEMCVEPRGVEEIRSYDCGQSLSSQSAILWSEIAARRLSAQFRSLLWVGASWVVLGVTLVAGLLLVAGGLQNGEHTIGDLVLIITLTIGLRHQLSDMLDTVKSVAPLGSAINAIVRVRKHGVARGGFPSTADSLRDGITIGITEFAYARSDIPALSRVNLHLQRGSLVAIVGENGAGKSTLANLLLGLLRPSAGGLLVDGIQVDPEAWRQCTTGAFQDFMKPPFLVREAIGIGDPAQIDDRRAVEEAVGRGGASGLVGSLPQGIDTPLATHNGIGLSHGQWQTIALARSRMRTAPLLQVLDEPTSALDAHAEYELFRWFAASARDAGADRGCISIMISHRYSAAYLADYIVVMHGGRVAESGTHDQLMAMKGIYKEMFEMQRNAYLTP